MPKTRNLSQDLWDEIKEQWVDGASPSDLATKYDIHANSIHSRKRSENWVRVEDVDTADVAGLEKKLADAEKRADEAERYAAERAPTSAVAVPTTFDEVVSVVGEEVLREETLAALASENVKRHKRGLPPVDLENSPEFKTTRDRLIKERLENRTKHVSQVHKLRVVKMVKPNGTIIQVPVEKQVSNEQAQEGTALWKAREKGFKPADPWLCQAYNCWLSAASDAAGAPTVFKGYCSAEHLSLDPYHGGRTFEGVTTT